MPTLRSEVETQAAAAYSEWKRLAKRQTGKKLWVSDAAVMRNIIAAHLLRARARQAELDGVQAAVVRELRVLADELALDAEVVAA